MNTHSVAFDGFYVMCSSDWNDITSSLPGTNPITMGRTNGVGALQFSPAFYRSGEIPNPTLMDLMDMAVEFGEVRGLGESFDARTCSESHLIAAVSYKSEGNYIRVWYLSESGSFILVTYVCDWEARDEEIAECERIVANLEFRER